MTAVSSHLGWAVGSTGAHQTLIERWDGSQWRRVASPTPAGGAGLQAVSAASPRDAWAVGFTGAAVPQPLILHWNGSRWRKAASPAVAGGAYLYGVAASRAGWAWAVGYTNAGATLIERWNGSAWRQVASPSPSGSDVLYGVTGISAQNAWTVGHTGFNTLIEHWNGRKWKQVASPKNGVLTAVASDSSGTLWAVGYGTGIVRTDLTLRWNGSNWRKTSSPTPRLGGGLNSVTVTSAKDAWAVGYGINKGIPKTLVLHWNGKAWRAEPSASPGSNSGLSGVAVLGGTVWAAGGASYPSSTTLLERWNGKALSVAAGSGGVPAARLAAPHRTPLAGLSPAQSAHVKVLGPVSCAGLYPPPTLNPSHFLASRVRFQTASGEAADATISGLLYSVDFFNVPASGETAIAYVTCNGDDLPSWGCQFTLQQNPLQVQYLNMMTHVLAGNYATDGNC